MDFDTAYNTLNLDPKTDYTFQEIRKKYHLLALEYHPDKNTDIHAHEKFQKITEAYELLKPLYQEKNHNEYMREKNTKSYMDIVYEFFGDKKTDNKDFSPLIDIFRNECYEYTLHTIQQLDYSLLMELMKYIELYFKIFNIPEEIREKINKIILNRMSNVKYHIIRPSLQNLINNDISPVICHKENDDNDNDNDDDNDNDNDNDDNQNNANDEDYIYVPLWHKELIYDTTVILCQPILPDYISIDEDNNIFYKLELSLHSIWCETKKRENFIYLQEFPNIKIDISTLYIQEQQTIIFKGCGISRINSNNILDVREKSDLIIKILLL